MAVRILVIGRHDEIVETLLRIIKKQEQWEANAALNDTDAKHLFDQQEFDIVLLSSGIEEESENDLRNHFNRINPLVTIIQHYGGGSGLLSNEIFGALQQKLTGKSADSSCPGSMESA